MNHIPVMPLEVSNYLVNNPNGLYIDCTFGDGGHTLHLLNNFKNIKIIAFDWDEDVSKRFFEEENLLKGRVIFIRENFKNIRKFLLKINVSKVDGVLADLGVSSKQLGNLVRGFSFNSDILDMRMDNRNKLTAKEIINSYSSEDLADIFYTYGEEYKSRQIAKAIVLRRKTMIIDTAIKLQEIIHSVKRINGKKNPATKVFQALRIFINNELKNLEALLLDTPRLLNTGGRIAIISFHSLEDRIVKKNFKHNSNYKVYKIITKKIITPSKKEIQNNYKSRSAKMRVAEKINV
ncbi:MAG: 16S rRNA (cytosine(1402)-N(4))-methyltransferase RsmH [Endomicrobium sp.]|jgi:16S rRNA (cytosine1402-N4)-methyltransferase|nr:16S rRNA (cytosine(1402)-N(4))-methyltransferase RsmH [Endomicrobium sp.]